MKVICFLRELDIPIDAISKILKEEHPEKAMEKITFLHRFKKPLLFVLALVPIAIAGGYFYGGLFPD